MPIAAVTVSGRSPSGVISSDSPTITPGGTPSVGVQLIAWEAQLWDTSASAPLASATGVVFRGWQPGISLVSGKAYEARVRVQDDTWAWSEWAKVSFTPSAKTPPPPAIGCAESAHSSSGAPRMDVTILFPPQAGFDFGQKVLVDVEREDERAGWLRVCQRWLGSGHRDLLVHDYGVPTAFSGRYRVRSTVWLPSGEQATGAWTYGPVVGLETAKHGGWLVDVAHPELAVHLRVQSRGDFEHDSGSSATRLLSQYAMNTSTGGSHHQPMIADRVGHQLPALVNGSVTAHVHTRAERDRALVLLTSGALLMLRGHQELGLDGEYHPEPDLWFRVRDAIKEKDVADYAHVVREISFDWTGQHPAGTGATR